MSNQVPEERNSDKLSAVKKALLQQRLRGSSAGAPKEEMIAKRPADHPAILSSMQQRLWYLDQLEPNTAIYNIQWAIKLKGSLDVTVLKDSLSRLIIRHEILRSRYRMVGDVVTQEVTPVVPIELPVITLAFDSHDNQSTELSQQLQDEGRRPFDLYNGPIFRLTLFKLAADQHVLVFTVHHIAFDGLSYRIFLSELVTMYEAQLHSQPDGIKTPEIQYADFAYWHQQWLNSPALSKQMDYWKDTLDGELPILGMPADYSRPAQQSFEGALIRRFVKLNRVDQLTALGRTENATLFMVLLSTFYVLLHRYTGQKDLLLGTPIANRALRQTEELVGHLVNTLVLRARIDKNPRFRNLLRNVRDLCLDAFANPDAPFERLVETLNPERDMSVTPIYQAMFAYQTSEGHPNKMADLEISQIDVPLTVARTDLSLWIDHTEDGLTISLEYCTALFSEDTMGRFLDNYMTLLASVVREPDEAIDQLRFVSKAEREAIAVAQALPEAAYPKDKCLHQVLDGQCHRDPERAAIQYAQTEINYHDLREQSNRLAHYLRREQIRPNAFVGICLERSADMVLGVVGILKSGGAYLPLDPDYPSDRLGYMLTDSKASVVITQSSLKPLLPIPEGVRVICLDEEHAAIADCPTTDLEIINQPSDLAYIIYTSGSTGKPKGVQVPHRAVVNFLVSMSRTPGIQADDVLLAVTTLSFDIHVLELFLPLIIGAKVVIADRATASDGAKLLGLLEQSKATIMQATPSTWRLLLAAGWRGRSDLRILCGGEAFPKDLLRELLPKSGSIWNMYGPTETTVWSSCCLLTDADQPILIGEPIGNTQIYILDQHLRLMPIGVPGELHIGGDGVTVGYLNREALTHKQFIMDPFRPGTEARLYKTGDLARLRLDGQFEYISRIDTQVKVRGFRIELGEIESVLSQYPSVAECVVTVREDQPGDVRLVGYLVLKAGQRADVMAYRNHLRQKLPEYMVPHTFIELKRLPLTPAGKIDRKNLPEPNPAEVLKTDQHVAPETPLELQLSGIWENLLGTSPISVTDNFFDIGGHSLLAVKLFSDIERLAGERLPLALLYQAPSIRQLSKIIEEKDWQRGWSTLVPINPGGTKPPLFLVHGAGGNVLLYRKLVAYLGADQPVYGLQAKGLDGSEPYHSRIEDMAAEYIQEIKAFQPVGPYYLGGYCMGGGIAYEMACQLHTNGDAVAMVAMFDTFNGYRQPSWMERIFHQYQRVIFHVKNYAMITTSSERRAFFDEKYQEAIRRAGLRFAVKKSRLLHCLKIRSENPLIILDHINDTAAIAYSANPYPGKIDLFIPKATYRGYEDPMAGWGNGLVGEPVVHSMNVLPGGTLNEPFVKELAVKLKRCLESAQLSGKG